MDIPVENVIAMLEKIANLHRTDDEHGMRASGMALAIGGRLNGGERLNADKLKLLDFAARIHDLGRVGVEDHIIAKPGKLMATQEASMRAHVTVGYDLLSLSGLPAEITFTVLYHHEHWDGSGYPKGLAGLDIPLFARIVCIADAWDAITHERPYKPAKKYEQALEEMNKSVDHFDPKLYTIFLSILKEQVING